MEKKPLTSKTLWVSVIAGLAGVIANFLPQANVVTEWINSNGAIIAMAWGVLGTVLRLVTKEKIKLIE